MSKIDHKTFCPLPWHSMIGQKNGRIGICCHNPLKEAGDELGNIQEHKFSDLWNSKKIRDIRSTILQGKKHRYCKSCFKQESLGITSGREEAIARYEDRVDRYLEKTDARGFYLGTTEKLDIRFSTLCNLSCRMCNSFASSRRLELDKILGHKKTYDYISEPYDTDNFWSDIELFRDLKTILVVGGEPMMNKNFYKFLNLIIDHKLAGNILLQVFTNLTILPGVNGYQKFLSIGYNNVFELFSEFRNYDFLVSIDGYKKSYEKIRIGSSWKEVSQNMEVIHEEMQKGTKLRGVSIQATVQVDNIYDFPKLYIYSKKKGFMVHVGILYFPDYLSISHLPSPEKIKITKIYLQIMSQYRDVYPEIENDFKKILSYMNLHKSDLSVYEKYIENSKTMDEYQKGISVLS